MFQKTTKLWKDLFATYPTPEQVSTQEHVTKIIVGIFVGVIICCAILLYTI